MKKSIRKEILNKRKSLSQNEVVEKSERIFYTLKTLDMYKNAKNVMIYIDFQNEVKTNEIIDDLIEKDKKVIIPICVPKTKEMILSQLLHPKEELTKGTFGVLEPKPEYVRPVDSSILDLIIVPGVCFDPMGYRIGYGGGYYDRFFPKLRKNIPSMAIAFDLQIIDRIPTDSYDQPVDYIVTESKYITCK